MDKKDCFLLGKVTSTAGIKGEVAVYLDTDYPERYEKLESVLIDLNDELTPFFIDHFRFGKKKIAFLKFENIDSADRAAVLADCYMYLPLNMLPKLSGKKFYFHEVIGFEIIDTVKGNIGEITDIIDNTASPIIVVGKGRNEILIPAVDDIINIVDRKNRTIGITAPEGLIDIYLEKKEEE